MSQASSNKRIAKNTLLLYFRMIFLSAISFFTVRVTLDALGVVNYGISNVVGSLVSSLTFISGTLSSATQRYFSYSLGKKDLIGYQRFFSILLLCYCGISIIILLVGEFLGYFFLNDWLKIPLDRLFAAKWYFQTVLGTFVFHLLSIPYTSSLIAHERMGGFAYISIADGIFKLIIAYLIYISTYDKLIMYGLLTMVESCAILVLYILFCIQNFEGCKFKIYWNKILFRELLSYTGWNLFGSVSGVLATQGQNILLNIYFGPIINTAKGIADKISSVIQSFSTNFYLAVSPQIIKSYASEDKDRMIALVITSTKFSFYLLLLLSYPIIITMNSILDLWLGKGNVSEEMIIFSRQTIIYCLVVSLEQPITQMIRATGNIKKYQIFVGVFTLMFLPLAALSLYYGFKPQSTMYVLIFIYLFVQIIRVYVAKRQLKFPVRKYLTNAIIPICSVSALLYIITPMLDFIKFHGSVSIFLRFTLGILICLCLILILGLTKYEKSQLLMKMKLKH